MPLATVAQSTLADAVDESLAAALAGRAAACLWCGGHAVVLAADIWSGAVTVACSECGTELSGVVPRHLREVPR
jgi:transcription elongation factor Elf1